MVAALDYRVVRAGEAVFFQARRRRFGDGRQSAHHDDSPFAKLKELRLMQ